MVLFLGYKKQTKLGHPEFISGSYEKASELIHLLIFLRFNTNLYDSSSMIRKKVYNT